MKNGLLSRALINVKYPTRDPLHQTEIGGGGVGDVIGGNYNIGFKSGNIFTLYHFYDLLIYNLFKYGLLKCNLWKYYLLKYDLLKYNLLK